MGSLSLGAFRLSSSLPSVIGLSLQGIETLRGKQWAVIRQKEEKYAIHIKGPTLVEAVGNKPKRIEEFFGRVNSETSALSIARMKSPSGWVEPAQTPEFDEYTVVLVGELEVEHAGGILRVSAGQAVMARAGERVRYSTPGPEGAEYIAVCLPAFSPDAVHRDESS